MKVRLNVFMHLQGEPIVCPALGHLDVWHSEEALVRPFGSDHIGIYSDSYYKTCIASKLL